MLKKLKDQLKAYKEIKTVPEDPTGVVRIKYSGKTGGKRDDSAVALQLALYWGDFAALSNKYVW